MPPDASQRGSLRGLYAITSDATPLAELAARVEQALRGGAALVQYRRKGTPPIQQHGEALMLNALCARYRVPLVIDDDVDLAWEVGAGGVHLGREDTPCREARRMLGPAAIIGVSCYDRLDLAIAAVNSGASYVAFGSFFPSRTKPTAVRPDPSLLSEARRCLSVPIAAIGGITPENGGALVAAGADLLAVIEGIFGETDSERSARRYAACFESAAIGTRGPSG